MAFTGKSAGERQDRGTAMDKMGFLAEFVKSDVDALMGLDLRQINYKVGSAQLFSRQRLCKRSGLKALAPSAADIVGVIALYPSPQSAP
ncbi:hypothetical protein cyc_02054 [Cyclospora cayetanensis]|uniref:Uncharacterized protein n=1 Tax=Cyclospora cayetanensis TaxID=88456 RepID=A0A1D3D3W4_9EIME|nr:hypothetical protein cyc_02054 [Cyclospora cayetanensis]